MEKSEEYLDTYMEQYRKELVEWCEAGIRGEVQLGVNTVTLALTNQCNLHCIMCPVISKEYKHKTYFNALPKMVTLEEVKSLMSNKIMKNSTSEDNKTISRISIDITNGETFLNPDIFEILQYLKEEYPDSEVKILSNGTIPPVRPEIVKYIDILAFSVDAGTKEVFEKIRTPSKYDHVIETIKSWVRARNKYNPSMRFRTSTTLSTLNIEDLPNVVKTVGEIVRELGGGWDSIYCQPVVIEPYQADWLHETTLDHVDSELGKRIMQETTRLAAEYEIRLDIPEAVYKTFGDTVEMEINKDEDSAIYKQAFCKKLSNGGMAFNVDSKLKYACCFMDKDVWRKLLVEYGIISVKEKDKFINCEISDKSSDSDARDLNQLYNCPGYWRLRKDLLEGKLKNACRDCIIGKSDYYTAVTNMKKIIEMDMREVQ